MRRFFVSAPWVPKLRRRKEISKHSKFKKRTDDVRTDDPRSAHQEVGRAVDCADLARGGAQVDRDHARGLIFFSIVRRKKSTATTLFPLTLSPCWKQTICSLRLVSRSLLNIDFGGLRRRRRRKRKTAKMKKKAESMVLFFLLPPPSEGAAGGGAGAGSSSEEKQRGEGGRLFFFSSRSRAFFVVADRRSRSGPGPPPGKKAKKRKNATIFT